MMPPPTMTTSALSTFGNLLRGSRGLDHPPHLEDQLERGKSRDVSVVEGRGNLDHVESDESRAARRDPEHVQRLAGGEPSGRWDLGPRSEGRIEHVDVEGDVHLLAVQPLGDLFRGAGKVVGDVSS